MPFRVKLFAKVYLLQNLVLKFMQIPGNMRIDLSSYYLKHALAIKGWFYP